MAAVDQIAIGPLCPKWAYGRKFAGFGRGMVQAAHDPFSFPIDRDDHLMFVTGHLFEGYPQGCSVRPEQRQFIRGHDDNGQISSDQVLLR